MNGPHSEGKSGQAARAEFLSVAREVKTVSLCCASLREEALVVPM